MRHPILCVLFFAFLCYFAVPQQASAATGYSDLNYNEFLNTVDGYSETQLSFSEAYYYDAIVYGYIYDQYGGVLDQGFASGGSIVSVSTQTYASPGVRYDLYSDHYVRAYFYYCEYYCESPRYSDYYGFDFYQENTFYGNFYSFYGYYQCYVFYYDIYLGTTGDSVSVPDPCPDTRVEIRANYGGSNAVLNNETRPALVGAAVQFDALGIIPDGPTTQGTFEWSADGGAMIPDEPISNYSYRPYWTSEGIKTVTVKYTPPGSSCQVTAWVKVNVTLPEFVSFSAEQFVNQINVVGCGFEGASYTLGCRETLVKGHPGIVFTATFRPPAGYISAPDESKLKFVQLVNTFSKERKLGSSNFQCQTARLYDNETTSGWQLDTSDPYSRLEESLKNFRDLSADGTLTIQTNDSPGHEVDGPVAGTLDYLYLDWRFEMYVVYFVDRRASVQRVLAKVPWTFGGEVVRDESRNPPYRENFTFTVPGYKPGTASVNVQTPYYGNAADLEDGACPGSPPPPDPCLEPPYYTKEARRPTCY